MPATGVDVITKVIANNPIKNGDAVVAVDKVGNISALSPFSGYNRVPVPSGVEKRLTSRFDDTMYYSS